MQKTIFFAYESGHVDNRDAIRKATEQYNLYQKTYRIKRWEDIFVSGSLISQRILDEIENCEIFACDLTYQNHNVFFELGYAIAKKKKLKIFLNPSVIDAKKNYADLKILTNIGYSEFANSKDIATEFQKKVTSDAVLFDKILPKWNELGITHEVFFINVRNKNQAAIELEDYFEKQSYDYISNNPDEISYQPLVWYLGSIISSNFVILHMVGKDKCDYLTSNAEYSLYAGIASGLGKKLLLLAPTPYKAPIDYTDILIEYSNSEDCIAKTETWVTSQKKQLESAHVDGVKKTETQDLSLLRLGIGYGVAEKEEQEGLECFVETDAYTQASLKNKILIVGRKGSGKTAIFLRLQDELVEDKNNFNIIIKPDSVDLLENVELAHLYSNERSKRVFLQTIWRYVIFSKIFFQIFIIINKLEQDIKYNEDVKKYYENNAIMFSQNFYGMIQYISQKFYSQSIINDPTLLEKINEQLYPMIDLVVQYFEHKKYQKISILADNLDSGWDAKNDLEIQSLMIVSLYEYVERLSDELRNRTIHVHTVIFLRKDIYNFLLKYFREPDKVQIDVFEINWEKFPQQLQIVIEKRFQKVLSLAKDSDVQKVWTDYFQFTEKKHPFQIILEHIVKRPRDAIYFISRMFESAANKFQSVVKDDDLHYAIDEYTSFLYSNLISELKAEYSEITGVLSLLTRTFTDLLNRNRLIPYEDFITVVHDACPDVERANDIIRSLMVNNYLIGVIEKKGIQTTNFDELIHFNENKKVKVLGLTLFTKYRIFIKMRLIPFSE